MTVLFADLMPEGRQYKCFSKFCCVTTSFDTPGGIDVNSACHIRKFLNDTRPEFDNTSLNIHPPEAAEKLKAKCNAEARLYDNVTVIFTEFARFARIAEQLMPVQLAT